MGNQLKPIPSNQTLSTSTLADYASNKSITPTINSSSTLESDASSRHVSPSPQPPSHTNRIVSSKIVQIAADFWNNQMTQLSYKQQLEIGVTIYLGMMVKNKRIQPFQKHFRSKDENVKIETISLKFVNMVGWLIRTLLRKDDNLSDILANVGAIHRQLNVDMKHFAAMLESLHETFTHYFPNSYKIQEKYAIDYTFGLATKLMMGQRIKPKNDDNYLKNLNSCLKSSVGREYLFKYLQQTWCDEIVIYLKAMMKFKNQTTDKGRFMIARNIIEVSIDSKSNLCLNISYETRQNMLTMMNHFESKFSMKEDFAMNSNVFQDVTYEVYKLMSRNHWKQFVKNMKHMNENEN